MQILIALHIASAVIFLGNLITAAFWKARSDHSGSPDVIAHTSRLLMHADLAFTGPGIAGLVVTGIWMVGLTGWRRFEEPWLAASLIMLVVTAIIWLAVLLPLQVRMARMSQLRSGGPTDETGYRKASKVWAGMGGIATLLPVVTLFLMVFKPGA